MYFKGLGLSVTFDRGMYTADFLDVSLNLITGLHAPFHKRNENLHYVNKKSNHPRNIVGSIVGNVSLRISKLSANKDIFDKHAKYYNNALNSAGFTENIKYKNSTQNVINGCDPRDSISELHHLL